MQWAARLRDVEAVGQAGQICQDQELVALMQHHAPRDFCVTYARCLRVTVDRQRAGFSSWYEMFPRSASDEPGAHGTLRDVVARLPYVAEMGFDVLYLPPIHPIGESFRKGKNNTEQAGEGDVGSPWAIGSSAGGHKAIHPQLGTLRDFQYLVTTAQQLGMEVALDIAFQCSPDHPYVKEHPEWFRQRPDGTIQYAENPPKKYQDIYPFDFESADWWSLWHELKSIFEFWIEQGIRIFRVDNPHTKPFPFWEWCIGEIKRAHPDVLFLAEAFTRPKVMHRLAKVGFTQSYTYFAWRNTKRELMEYVTALTRSETREFLRPNFWPNTPDILTEYLQLGGRPAFMSRLVLAALLSPNYGIYGPPFEHCWNTPLALGSEEYLDSEKYQIRHHDLDRPSSLKDFIARVNRLRREHAALQTNEHLRFLEVDNEEIICFSKSSADRSQVILAVVSLDPHHRQSGWVELPLEEFGLDADRPCQVHDLLSDARFLWHGRRNYVELDPAIVPAHIFQVRRRVRSERDFEYFL
jgi:starch synthase (maltosyl-transferring)